MAELRDFRLPDLGEGLTEGEILHWLVRPGETVALNQPLVEVETAKAAVEVPSPYAGVVITLHAAEGDTVDVGAPIVTVDTEAVAGGAPAEPASPEQAEPASPEQAEPASPEQAEPASPEQAEPASPEQAEFIPTEFVPSGSVPPLAERTGVLVGYGPRTGSPTRRRRVAAVAEAQPPAPPVPARVSAAGVAARVVPPTVLAKPPVRKYARDHGVELAAVVGTGDGGVVTRADVDAHLGAAVVPAATPGAERRIPVRGVRKLTAQNMVASAFTAPHVTQFLTLDVTEGMAAVRALAAAPEFAGTKVTPLTLVARALVLAVRRHPEVNSSWDDAAQEIVVKASVNLGIAAATPRGLLVPNIKGAERLDLPALAAALSALSATAREGRTQPGDLTGGSITITNVGIFGVDTGTPILNPGESAILCLGAIREMPWVHEGELAVRWVTTLAVSFDHRVVDGALGSAFLSDVGAAFADPLRMLAWS
jgi:2-oxoisovalerate dehydrogenase E2 component (dihydrolipoyl transacylase)